MSRFKYSGKEMELNKILKMNQDMSLSVLNNPDMDLSRKKADQAITDSIDILNSFGRTYSIETGKIKKEVIQQNKNKKLEHRPVVNDWDELCKEANAHIPGEVVLEDILSEREISAAFQELEEINQEFSKQTDITNKVDLSFLAIAVALQVLKNLMFPYIAEKFHYGDSIDSSKRLAHNDKSIEQAHREANDKFRDKKLKNHSTGYWINILYQTPAYDITRGSKALGINMGGKYHRMYTLGHDPILGWFFGTMNILTDTVTLNNYKSYRVVRNPMRITREMIPVGLLVQESYNWIRDDFLNLPAAVFAQAQHLKSDKYTKLGLPVPLISSFNENFASNLYKSNYDNLCFSRDLKIVGASFAVSKMIDILIILMHGLFRKENESLDMFEIRTRKILLISNSIASTSTIINAGIMTNPKKLDIGGILNTIAHLFMDVRFISKIKQEFIEHEIAKRVQEELLEVDKLYESI